MPRRALRRSASTQARLQDISSIVQDVNLSHGTKKYRCSTRTWPQLHRAGSSLGLFAVTAKLQSHFLKRRTKQLAGRWSTCPTCQLELPLSVNGLLRMVASRQKHMWRMFVLRGWNPKAALHQFLHSGHAD
jgi:hypothetical protein